MIEAIFCGLAFAGLAVEVALIVWSIRKGEAQW